MRLACSPPHASPPGCGPRASRWLGARRERGAWSPSHLAPSRLDATRGPPSRAEARALPPRALPRRAHCRWRWWSTCARRSETRLTSPFSSHCLLFSPFHSPICAGRQGRRHGRPRRARAAYRPAPAHHHAGRHAQVRHVHGAVCAARDGMREEKGSGESSNAGLGRPPSHLLHSHSTVALPAQLLPRLLQQVDRHA